MEVDELLKKAWEAVEKSGVPEPLREVAFREAVETLRGGSASAPDTEGTQRRTTGRTTGKRPEPAAEAAATVVPDEATFFSVLAEEAGVEESDLRDVLQLTRDGVVHVSPPTRDLGTSVAQQAKTVIALVAGARGVGLEERPVSAAAVRKELERKRCYDPNNFANKHLGPLRGFNAGSNRTEIVLTSKWEDDFRAAVEQALGRAGTDED